MYRAAWHIVQQASSSGKVESVAERTMPHEVSTDHADDMPWGSAAHELFAGNLRQAEDEGSSLQLPQCAHGS